MHSNTHINKHKANRQASFDSEDEGHFIADEQANMPVYNHLGQEEFYNGTQEHDQGGRNRIQGFVTPTAFIDKNSYAYRKNRFVINNNGKIKAKVQTTQNSIHRKQKLNFGSESPDTSQNFSAKNVAFISAQKPAIQNLPPSIVLNSKQIKMQTNNQSKGTHTVSNSFANSPNTNNKNLNSFAEQRNHEINPMTVTSKSSPVSKHKQYQYIASKQLSNTLQSSHLVRQSFKSSQTAGSQNQNDNTASQYNTLSQNIKSQMNIIKKQKQIDVQNANHIMNSQKNVAIKTKCVSLEVSQERESQNSASSYFKTNLVHNKLKGTQISKGIQQTYNASNTQTHSGILKLKRKPIGSHTMQNSKQGSLNNTPTRPQPIALKTPDDSTQKAITSYKNKMPIENSRMDVLSPPSLMNSTQNNDILQESIHNIQFTRNTQANAKTVSNIAQVLHPQNPNYDSNKKNLSHTKSVALSIENSDANQGQSRISSICTSLTHLNKNINLRLDKKMQNDDAQSKVSSQRGEPNTIKSSYKASYNKIKKTKVQISQSEAISPIKNNEMISHITVSPSQLAINPVKGTSGVTFIKKQTTTKNLEQVAAKNMNINESLGKRTIGLSSKLKLGSTHESIATNKSNIHQNISQTNTSNQQSINSKLIQNYVSKTAQASAYASKNNSNSSSIARGENSSPIVQHKALGSRLNAVLKKKKPIGIRSDQDESSNAQTSKQSASNFNIGNSSLSLKDKQISLTANKKQSNVNQDSSQNALRHVTAHHVQSNKSNMYATVGSKILKNATGAIKKGTNTKLSASGTSSIGQSQNFLSLSNTNLKQKATKKIVGNTSVKPEMGTKDAYRSANASSSLTNNSKLAKSGARLSKKIGSRLPQTSVHQYPKQESEEEYEESPVNSSMGEQSLMFNSAQNKGISKKQLQPSQAKNSMRSVKDSYRRAGFSSIQMSQSPDRPEQSNNNYSTRQPQASNVPLFSFNDIKEEIKETESQNEININVKPTLVIDSDLMQQTENFRQMQHKETPKSTKRKHNYEETENSVMMQLQEYKRDIINLKKQIWMYFNQYGEMQSSSCSFYRIGRVLGRGAFGKVNLACHKVTEHLVAIKALEKKVLDHEKNTKKRVMQEIAILKQSNHPNVVRLYDSFETHKHICFVMELCQGGDLLSYVRKRRKLKEDNAKYLFKQLIEGLDYIHTQKFVIHRDIKLDNILLDASGQIKICDFGVSKQVKSDKERMYEQCGTPAYIAPEVSNKQKGYKGFKADMWSAGVCLYVMLIGTVPFRAASMKELHEMIRKGKYSLQGEILSNEAKHLLQSLLNVNYNKRLSARETLNHPWFKMSQDGNTKMNYNQVNLSEIIFTQKEQETIQKDYISRLEKLKKTRLRKETTNKSYMEQKKDSIPHNTTTFDEDYLFTEHDLDTKEDQKLDIFDNPKNVASLFNENRKQEFQKFEGLIVKKPQPANEYAIDEDKNLSEKSVIFCPFNSSYSDFDEEHPELFDWPESVKEILQPKKSKIIKFSKKCRDLNREYECNNNADLDNGVYNAFVNEQEMEAEKNQKLNQLNNDEDEMPTQSLHQSSYSSLNDSANISLNSDNDDLYQLGQAPKNSFVQDEISIHESMQRGHEGQWVVQSGPKKTQKVAINSKIIDYTIELFKYNSDKSSQVLTKIKSKLVSGLENQDLNYLTAAYYLSQKYDQI